jgi:hypothetical protein
VAFGRAPRGRQAPAAPAPEGRAADTETRSPLRARSTRVPVKAPDDGHAAHEDLLPQRRAQPYIREVRDRARTGCQQAEGGRARDGKWRKMA